MVKKGVSNNKIYNLYSTLHTSSSAYKPWIKKHPIIWFLFDTIRVFKYIYYVIIGKRPSLLKIRSYADERKSVYEKLEIWEI